MKQFAAFILLIIYFVTSTGGTINYHFCMGEVADFSFWENEEKNCGRCGMEKQESEDKGCCRDERQWIKIEDDQKTNTNKLEISRLQPEAISFVFFNNWFFASQNHHPFPESKAPLRSCELAVYLLNCVFRI